MNLSYPPRVKLAHLPTPIEKLERLSLETGVNIYLKRDDLTGSELSGNKIRKLEFHLAHALSAGAGAVITTGGIQSNHCRTTAFAARKLGLTPILILTGGKPEKPEGNYFLEQIAEAKIFFAPDEEFFNPETTLLQAQEWAHDQDLKPITVPLGASDALGLWGYINAFAEILNFSKESGVFFNNISCSVGSGGTYAGLLAGTILHHSHTEITGFNILENAQYLKKIVRKQCRDFQRKYFCNLGNFEGMISIIDGYVGEGYGKTWDKLDQFIKHMARLEGILLDPVYTGKAFYGLVDQIENGSFKKGDNVLFIHTGGVYGLFASQMRANL